MHASSSRALARAIVLTLGLAAVPAFADAPPGAPPKAPAPKPPPVMASDEEVAKAIAEFKEAYKAKGLKGEEKLSQREFAMRTLAKLQHPQVVEALAPAAKDSDTMLRMIGTIYLGDQVLMPGLAGKHVVAAWKRGQGDDAFAMTAMQSIAKLRFLGAREDIKGALKSQNFAVKKMAIGTIVGTGDLRLVHDMLQLVGVQLPATGQGAASQGQPSGGVEGGAAAQPTSSGPEVTQEGYSWEGAEAVVDWGLSDNTAENAAAQAQVEAQIASNQAAAAAAANGGGTSLGGGGGGGTGGGGGGASPGGKGGGRRNSELIPLVLGALQRLTGVTFTGPAHVKRWWGENADTLTERLKKLDDKEKFQKEEAAAQSK